VKIIDLTVPRGLVAVSALTLAVMAVGACGSASSSSTKTTATTKTAATATTKTAATTTTATTPKAGTFGDGTYTVGQTVKAGTYRAAHPSLACYWARLRGFGGSLDDIIANETTSHPTLVTIAPTDKGFKTSHCGDWTADLSQITSSKTSIPPGEYIVNTDIEPGTYSAPGGEGCYWARLSGFGGALDSVIANDNPTGTTVVTIASTDKGFKSNDCGTFAKQATAASTAGTGSSTSGSTSGSTTSRTTSTSSTSTRNTSPSTMTTTRTSSHGGGGQLTAQQIQEAKNAIPECRQEQPGITLKELEESIRLDGVVQC
jgi:hypothetical protein